MIRFGFSTGKHSPVSAIIRFFTRSKVSHAYVIFYDVNLADEMILEADVGGFQPMRYSVFKRHNTVVAEVDPGMQERMSIALKTADRWMGQGYDYLGLVGDLLPMIGRWFKFKWRSPVHDPKAMFCSEAMVRMLQTAGYPRAGELVGYETTPQDLLDFLQKNVSSGHVSS